MTKKTIALLLLGLVTSLSFTVLSSANVAKDQKLNGTVILRVDQRNKEVSMISTTQNLVSKKQAEKLARIAKFVKVPKDQVTRHELDQDGGASSWYWFHGYNYNYLNWYGHHYAPAYTYSYNYYTYYYYTSYHWAWGLHSRFYY